MGMLCIAIVFVQFDLNVNLVAIATPDSANLRQGITYNH